MEGRRLFVSIVIPVYNSPALEELTERIEAVFAERTDRHEIIFVDDSSPDREIWPRLARLAQNPSVTAIQLTRNFGQHAATLCGLKEASGDLIITMDDDLQHSPEDIPKFLAVSGRDIVVAQFQLKRHSVVKRAGSRVKGWFDRIITGVPGGIRLSSYRMLSRAVVDGMLSIHTPRPFIPALMFHVSKNAAGLELLHHPRRGGESGYTFWKLLRIFSDLIINNSSLVLRVVGQLGLALALISFAIASLVVYKKLAHGIAIQGWASLFAALLLIGGLLLFSLGIVGEYLIRIIESSEARPTYFVARKAGVDDRHEKSRVPHGIINNTWT
jgi:dolichol-phosphate mannosyltransferase/undecaprenyl-phosphate 4-deoxy-4-formamido-L-arabinose transferase